jgi:hypothetical protein
MEVRFVRRKWFKYGGVPKRGWCRDIWCDSSWETAFVLWCLDNGKEIIRNTRRFPYKWRNGVRYYQPDFIVDGRYAEVKGVMDRRSARKLSNFPWPIDVYGEEEIKICIDYAIARYGKDYAALAARKDEQQ